jgi:hypothetical protein
MIRGREYRVTDGCQTTRRTIMITRTNNLLTLCLNGRQFRFSRACPFSSLSVGKSTVAEIVLGAVYFDTIGPDGADFEYLPNGDYRILISMLKPGASSSDMTEWESWLSPTIRLLGDWRDA